MGKRIDLHRKVSGSTVMKWVLVIFMAFSGVMALSEKQIFPGIIAALTVILLLSKKISRRVKITSFLIGFIVFSITLDTSVNKNNSKSNNTPEQTEKIVKAESQHEFEKRQKKKIKHLTEQIDEYLGGSGGNISPGSLLRGALIGSRLIGEVTFRDNVLIVHFKITGKDNTKEDIMSILDWATVYYDEDILPFDFVNIKAHKIEKVTDRYGNEKVNDEVEQDLFYDISELKKVNFDNATPDMVYNLYNNKKSKNPHLEKIVKAEGEKPSSKAQSSNEALESTNSVPTKDSEDNENGWKNLKWGMTLKEVSRFDEDLRYFNFLGEEKECGNTFLLKTTSSIYFEREKSIHDYDVSELACSWGYTEILFYKGKFFGKIVKTDGYENNEKTQNIIITQLKEKYPNGKISYVYGYKTEGIFGIETYEYKHETKVGILEKMRADIKIPVFEYKSNKITVFINESFYLYFYDTKVLDELVRRDKEQQKKIEDDETSKTKQLF